MEETRGHIAIGEADKVHLRRAGKWASFIAIVQFIFIGLGLVAALFMLLGASLANASMAEMTEMREMPAGFMTWYAIFVILTMVVSFFLALYLFRFATKTLSAIDQDNAAAMTEAYANLGKYFRLSGIFMIIVFALIVLMIVFAIIFAGAVAGGLR